MPRSARPARRRRLRCPSAAIRFGLVAACALSACAGSSGGRQGQPKTSVALVLGSVLDPLTGSVQAVATSHAKQAGITLTVVTALKEGDVATQITAIDDAAGAHLAGIVVAPISDAVIPPLKKARAAGVFVVTVGTPPSDDSAFDLDVASDDTEAGRLIGRWTAATLAGGDAVIAMLDLTRERVFSYDVARDHGFLSGMGIAVPDENRHGSEQVRGRYTAGAGGAYEIACHEATNGITLDAASAMTGCLSERRTGPAVNVVYAFNDAAALGAAAALKAAGRGATVVSVGGSCPGVAAITASSIDAIAQQDRGLEVVRALDVIDALVRTGTRPRPTAGKAFLDVGSALVTSAPVPGVASISVADATAHCWG